MCVVAAIEKNHREYVRNGIANAPINHGQSEAKLRVTLFVLVFIINGFFSKLQARGSLLRMPELAMLNLICIDFLLSVGLVIYEADRIPQGPKVVMQHDHRVNSDYNMTSPRLVSYNVIIALQVYAVLVY